MLHECLTHSRIEHILLVTRRPSGISHPKVKEILHTDMYNLGTIESQLTGYDACLFCLGTSVIGKTEEEYTRTTYTLTLNFAETLCRLNPGMTFCYVSGASTDSTEQGRVMWARVKGRTENALMKLPFKAVYNFRPGYMHPTPGLKNTLRFYKYISWMYPFMRAVMPNSVSTLRELGLAMIKSVTKGYEKKILEVKDIVALSQR